MGSPSDKSPSFDMHMYALGRLCIVWAYVDRLLNDTIQAFLGCSHAQAAIIGTEADSAAARCKMLQNLAFDGSPSEEWRDTFVALIKRLLDEYGPKRNRYIHDYWTVASGTLEKMDRRAAVKRAQSRQPPKLVFNTWQATPPKDVENLAVDLTITALGLQTAIADLTTWKREGRLEGRGLLIQMGLARARLEHSPAPAAKRRGSPPTSPR